MSGEFSFRLAKTDSGARLGEITTAHGVIRTPAFMPVGTAATVKAVYVEQLKAAGADVILGNTYHLMLRPGAERIARLGGLHQFMRWDRPILTDCGGFQVMSLAKLRKITDEGVAFQSHIDGARHMLTPERAVEIQCLLGSDIQMQLDECVALPASRQETEAAMRRSLAWAERCRTAFARFRDHGQAGPGQALFGIVQGGIDADLRQRSADALVAMDLAGYAIGGLAVGEPQEAMLATLETTAPRLPAGKPRYLMGVGTPNRSHRERRSRHRYVRLRDADPVGPPWAGLHLGRQGQPAQRPLRRRSVPARCGEQLPGGARLQPRLPAPPRQVGGVPGRHAAVVGQRCLLPGADGGHALRHRPRPLCRLGYRDQGTTRQARLRFHRCLAASAVMDTAAARRVTRSRCSR